MRASDAPAVSVEKPSANLAHTRHVKLLSGSSLAKLIVAFMTGIYFTGNCLLTRMTKPVTVLLLYCVAVSVVRAEKVEPNMLQLQEMLSEAGYSDWTEAHQFLITRKQPSLVQFLRETWTVLKHKGGKWNCTGRIPGPPELRFFFTTDDAKFFATILMTSVLLVCIRAKVTPWITNWAVRSGLNSKDAAKTPECVWKGISHGVLWIASLYVVVLSGRYRFFQSPCEVWNGILWNAHLDMEPIPSDLRFIYGLQLTHYFHAVYATMRFESRRADFLATVVHHVITIALLTLSFSMRFFRIGALVLFLHDVSDVLLECTKLNVYFRVRHGRRYPLNKYLGDLGFLAFATSWAVFRLYWFPVKVMHSSNWCAVINHGCVDPKIFWPFNGLLWALLALHFYWFGFILILVYKIVTGQVHDIEDTREPPMVETGEVNGKIPSSENVVRPGSQTNGYIARMNNQTAPTGDSVRYRPQHRLSNGTK